MSRECSTLVIITKINDKKRTNMKRLWFVLLLMVAGLNMMAQPTVYPVFQAGAPGYLFTPPPSQEGVVIQSLNAWGGYPPNDFKGTAYRTPNVTTVYGVAVAAWDLEYIPYFFIQLFAERRLDSTSLCAEVDTVRSELYCFMEKPPVHYASFQFVRTNKNPMYPSSPEYFPDTCTVPFYEFYFAEPIVIPANQRFFVGFSFSPYSVWNHVRPETNYWPYNYQLKGISFKYMDPSPTNNFEAVCSSVAGANSLYGDGLDSVWGYRRRFHQGLVDWACYSCLGDSSAPGKYSCGSFFPIVRPPVDSSRVNLPHLHPLRAHAVQNFRLTELDSAHAAFAWDLLPPSDWGPVIGVNADRYQINYAPYMQEYDEADTLGARTGEATLWMNFDSTVMYKARCRARSRHLCDIHDTLVYGDWSREVYFHTGVGTPDTIPLVCLRIDSLRYVGLWGGYPKFEWGRCSGHNFYEVQLASAGSDNWRRVDYTSENNTVLRNSLDPAARYWLRVQAVCNHRCHIHDTVMRSPWSDTVEFCLAPQGVDEVETDGLSLVPNPAHAEVTLSAETDITHVALYDMQGHLVLEKQTHGHTVTLSLRTLAAGSYIVHADTPLGRLTRKLTVE